MSKSTIKVGRWFVKVIRQGDCYGLKGCLVHTDAEPSVEFYDSNQDPDKFGPLGQFVSRYYLTTLLQHDLGAGLCLDGGIPEWSVSQIDMAIVHGFLMAQDEADEYLEAKSFF